MNPKQLILVSFTAAGFLLPAGVLRAQDARKTERDAPPPARAAEERPETPPFDDRADRLDPFAPGPPGRDRPDLRDRPHRRDGPDRHDGRGREDRPRRPDLLPPGPPQPLGLRPPGPPRPPEEPDTPRPFRMSPEALERYDPELYKLLQADQDLERRTADLAMRWRRAPQEERAALQRELAELVSQHFEVRQERRRLQLKRLEEELQKLREAIERRDAAREQVIDRRVAELLGVEDELGF